MTPPFHVAPVRRRVPGWAIALGGVGVVVLVVGVFAWTPEEARITQAPSMTESESADTGSGAYVALADARPEEEPPPVTAIAAEFGHEIDEDRNGVSWAASIRNTHGEYAATLDILVTVKADERSESEVYSSFMNPLLLPGGEFKTGDHLLLDEALPAYAEVEIAVIEVEWFVFDGDSPPEPEGPVLSSRVDSVAVDPEEARGISLTVTFMNTAGHAVDTQLTAIFHRADGSLAGGSYVIFGSSLPSGESTHELEFRDTLIPAGADLSLTEIVPAW